MKNQISESKLKSLKIKKADKCFKECEGDCLVSGTLKLYSYCNYCKKLELQNRKIEIPEYKIQKFKCPIDFTDFPVISKGSVVKKNKNTLELYLKGYFGDYVIETFRNLKLMDCRILLVTFYLADYHKRANFKNKFIDWLELLEVEDTGFYRKAILEGLDYWKKTTFYTPYIYDLKLKKRSNAFNLTDKGEIDFKNLPSFSVWNILNSYHYTREKGKRKSKLEIRIENQYYERIVQGHYYKLVELKKILLLKDIALRLYLFIIKYDPKNISSYTLDFEELKAHIGITDTNLSRAEQTFKKIWNDIKNTKLLKGYQVSKIFISKKDNRKKIKFSKPKDLIKIYKEKIAKT